MSLLLALQGGTAEQPITQDEWNWDDVVTSDQFFSGYQNSDATPVLSQAYGDAWDWSESLDDEWETDQALQSVVVATAQPISDEWDWSESLSSETIGGGYQQADNAPIVTATQNPDADWDWDEHVTDEWTTDQAVSVAVVASPIQHTHSEWDWDEALYPEMVVSGYQQADNEPVVSSDQAFQTEWEFGADLSDEDGWSNHFTNYDPLSDQSIPDVWGWDERADDDWWTEHVTVANVAVVTDPIQHTSAEWDWDEVLYSDIVTSGYQQADNAVVTNSDQQPQTDWDFDSDFGGESGWNNHYTAYDPETQTFDDPWDWDESCEYEWQDESSPVVANNAPVISPVQHTNVDWEWGDDGDDSILELIEYSPVGDDYVPPVPDVTDTHDGFWRKEYAKMFAHKPKLAEVVEIIQENPKEAIAVVREMPELKAIVYERYPDIDYSKVINDARIALFIAKNLLNAIELQRIQDEEDDLLIMLLLSL